MKESRIEANACKRLWGLRARAIKLTGIRGIPDRIVLWEDENGEPRFFFIEFKNETGRLSKAQERIQNQLPGNVYVCRSTKEAVDALQTEKTRYKNVN